MPAAFPPAAHQHAQGDVAGLTEALAGKADTGHTHPEYLPKTDPALLLLRDTGWRKIPAAALENGWTAGSSTHPIGIRRTGDTVYLSVDGAVASAATGNTLWTLPTGFVPSVSLIPAPCYADSTKLMYARVASSLVQIDRTSDDTYPRRLFVVYQTKQAWPAVLPGVPG